MEKTFDAVEFMRKRREQIDEEDAALTWQERSAKTRKLIESDPLWQRLRNVAPVSRAQLGLYAEADKH